MRPPKGARLWMESRRSDRPVSVVPVTLRTPFFDLRPSTLLIVLHEGEKVGSSEVHGAICPPYAARLGIER